MMRKKINFVSKIIFLSTLALSIVLSGCGSFLETMHTPHDIRMKNVQEKHHIFCTSLNFGKPDAISKEAYWRCRMTLAQDTLKFYTFDVRNIRKNLTDVEYDENMKPQFAHYYELSNDYRNEILNNRDHKKCLAQGYDMNSLEGKKVEEYLQCRRRFTHEWQLVPPYNKVSYYDRPADTYSVAFAINKKLDNAIDIQSKAQLKYPFCAKAFDVRSEEFKLCISDYDSYKICMEKIPTAKKQKQFEEIVICQKKSYVRFPDSLVKDDRQTNKDKEIKEKNRIADATQHYSLGSLGLTNKQLEQFHFTEKKEEKADKEKEPQNKLKNFNTKNELYSRVEVAKLRQKFIALCVTDSEYRVNSYEESLTRQCNLTVVKWEGEKK